ncbi:MAG TPA: CHASE domain-containing protein, partial [Verrucomicrobiae bacterium]
MNAGISKPPSPAPPTGKSPPATNHQSWFTHSLAWIVLVLSLTASAGGWFIAHKHDELTARKQFEEEANRIQTALSERMIVYQNVLHGGLGLFAASVSVERGEWKAYVDTVSVNERFPGIDGLGFIAEVPREKLQDFLSATRADQAPDFQLKNPGTNQDLFIVKYFEPQAAHAAMIGEDIGADPSLRAMAEKARDSGQLVVSGRLTLQDQGSPTQNGFLMLQPVFRNGLPAATLAERRANIVGWVYARFILSQLLAGFQKDQGSLLRFQIVDRVARANDSLLFDSSPPGPDQSAPEPPRFSSMQVLPVGQHAWLVNYSSKPSFNKSIQRDPEWLAGLGGGIFSVLIFGIALSLTTTRARALAMADKMTAAFREANVQLQKEIEERQRGDRRTAMQHAVVRVLAEAETLAEATPKIIEAVCESVGWDLGAIWRIDPQIRQLHCVEFWQRPGLNAAAFEAETRKLTFRPGQGLPGRVWASPLPIWIADITRETSLPRSKVAAATGLHAAFAFPILMGDHFL